MIDQTQTTFHRIQPLIGHNNSMDTESHSLEIVFKNQNKKKHPLDIDNEALNTDSLSLDTDSLSLDTGSDS